MHELNEIKSFEEPKIEEEKYSEYGAVIDSTIEATNTAAMKLNICTPMHRKHIGLSQHYAVMEECIAIFGG